MKNKGFTLVELLAVVVIMGMLLLIVFPATSRLMRDNEERAYDTYYEIAEKGLEKYAKTRRDDIGGITGKGCIDDKTLSYLVEANYIKPFEGKDGVVCKSPNEYSLSTLEALGFDTSVEYVNLRIDNDEGKITTQMSMICMKEGKSKAEYIHVIEKETPCNRYVAEVSNSLVKTTTDPSNPNKLIATPGTNNNYYVSGTSTNNYVWYSGKMWRIVSYNSNDKTMKLVTDDNISIVTYTTDANDYNYRNSNINLWLNNIFLKSLRNPEKFILDSEWNYTATSTAVEPARTTVTTAKVGMLNYYEYSKVGGGFLNIGKNYWLLSNHTTGKNVWYVNSSNTATYGATNVYLGVRPSIVLRPNVTVVSGGDGTALNPYRLTGDVGANSGTLINTRYAGEYVSFNGTTFRIVDVKDGMTKLTAAEPLAIPELQFHFYDKIYSSNTYIGEYLATWTTPVIDKLADGDFCRETMTTSSPQTTACVQSDVIVLKVGIHKIGEMFTVNSNNEYWTLTNSDENHLYVVEPDGTLRTKEIEEYSGVRPVIYLKSNTIITGGNGTQSNPYTID